MESVQRIWKKRELATGMEPTDIITAFTALRPDGYDFGGEMHDFWELVLVRSGFVTVAEGQRVVRLKKNMFIVHSPMAFHRLWCAGSDAEISVITFCAPHAERLTGLVGCCPPALAEQLHETVVLAGELLCVKERNEALEGRVRARLSYILHELCELDSPEQTAREMSDAEKILAIIDEHYLEELTLESLAGYCHMSESKIKKEFRSVYEGGVMKYVCRLRMRDAAGMIAEGKSTEEICEALSIRDKNYFSFAFRRELGITPSEYRRSHKKGGV